MLSTISGTPASCAMSAIASMSVMMPPGLAMLSMKTAFVCGVIARLEAVRIARVGPVHMPVEFGEALAELVDRAAIELARGDDLVARLISVCSARSCAAWPDAHGKAGAAAFQRRDALLQHRIGRVHDARIDVAEDLEVEQRRGMIGVLEHEGRRLVDRRGARAGRGIGLRAGMHAQRVEAIFAHRSVLLSERSIRAAISSSNGHHDMFPIGRACPEGAHTTPPHWEWRRGRSPARNSG